MNYHKISKFDTANGSGIGSVLWVSGCNHQCKECHNPQTWDENSGQPFTGETLRELLESLSNPHVKRFTLSGGDPLFPSNRLDCQRIAQQVKLRYPDKKIWLYTGYSWDDVKDLRIMEYIDVLVDGEFKIELKDISLPFCGSQNQRIIDVPQTLESGKIVLWENRN